MMNLILSACGITIRDLVEANEEMVKKNINKPQLTYETSEDLVKTAR